MMPIVSHIKPPDRGRNTHRVVLSVRGRKVLVGGYRGLQATKRLQAKLDVLVEAYHQGDPTPPALVKWTRTLDKRRAKTLIAAGLIDARHRRAALKLDKHIEDFNPILRTRNANGDSHVAATLRCLNRVKDGLELTTMADLTKSRLLGWLDARGYAPATVRHYLQAWATFTHWLTEDGRIPEDPLAGTTKPAPTPGFDRRPLEVQEVRTLLAWLESPQADAGYTPKPWYNHTTRRMVYWTAIKTGFRKTELGSLDRHRFYLDATRGRPYIQIPGRDAKNKQMAGVPIPRELAEELAGYTAMMAPSVRVFRLPKGSGAKDWLHRDLKGAGLGGVLDTDQETDFHSLRATAIVTWLEVDGFSQLMVKELARFKTLAMVQKYVRGFRATESSYDRLDQGAGLAGKQREADHG